ncbi:rsbT antagonist protein RsbS [Thermocatellispora tengchongensis]|uniref:RsbT antagonist protein RsbS n=1 Tax=Thermocatellispora tengchongensis TaxID=1073253 RepID=A0A840PPS3_9ACTN|nr:STAS domain-containing protein [Thermocatellispora tengchongensis]MBB5139077.1 rsbT antagonist protein RsbS [Thermocatellispora tengchongensis]
MSASEIPILRLGTVLLAGLGSELDDKTAVLFADELSRQVADTGARAVVLDITKLDVIDSFAARILVEIATMARLLGARVVLAGMRYPVAITLVELGLGLPGVLTALSVEHALKKLSTPESPRERPGGSRVR